jgi:hypothetical protein
VSVLLVDPYTWFLAVIIVVFAIVFGRLRHEPWWAVTTTAIGANAFLTGIRWAGLLGDEAIWAALLAAAGFGVWTEVAARIRGRPAGAHAESPS